MRIIRLIVAALALAFALAAPSRAKPAEGDFRGPLTFGCKFRISALPQGAPPPLLRLAQATGE
jgi:hypothetical protein